MTEKTKRKHLISIIIFYLETAKSEMTYLRAVATTKEAKKTCTKSINSITKAIWKVDKIKHIEILEYIYSSFIGNNVIAYSVSGSIVISRKLAEYDKDENIEEFKAILEEQRKDALEKEKARKETIEAVRKAKAEGKRVEMVYDEKTKTTKPLIIEDKN